MFAYALAATANDTTRRAPGLRLRIGRPTFRIAVFPWRLGEQLLLQHHGRKSLCRFFGSSPMLLKVPPRESSRVGHGVGAGGLQVVRVPRL